MPPPDPTQQTWPIGLGAASLRALLYVLLVFALAEGVLLEAVRYPDLRFSERGFTEIAQSVLLAGASALLLYTRQVLRVMPSVTLLLFGLVFASLIREQDNFLDVLVADGTWQVLVTLTVLPILYWTIRKRRLFVAEFRGYANSFSFGFFAAGFLTTYVFSRLYGRTALWEAVLQENYHRDFKNAAEEVVELFGYALILIGMFELVLLARRWAKAPQ